jgi:hypothetical protein
MNNRYFISLLVLGIAFLLALGTGSKKRNERSRFEAFLNKEYRKAPKISKDEKGMPAADQPDVAAFQDYLMTVDPHTGTVPRERLLNAYRQIRNDRYLKNAPISLQWTGYESDMGGRTRTIMYDPNDATHKKVWAGSVTGGLWYNPDITDINSAWTPVNDFWADLAIRCITYDPNNPMTFYLGTGEVETAMQTYRESSGLGDGIWKSTDGGQTWSLLTGTTGFAYVTDIQVRNENGASVVYAGVASGLYEYEQHQSHPSDGLFRSTDGGATWLQVLPNIPTHTVPYCVSDIAIGADGRIFVGTRPNLDGAGGATFMYSDSGLPGSWTVNDSYRITIQGDPVYNIPGRVELATAPSDANVVYALIASGFVNTVNNFNYFYCFYILRSSDKGVTWTQKNIPTDITAGENWAYLAWHGLDAAVDPNNANNLFIGGLDVHKSTNGGNSWTRVSNWADMYSGGGPTYIHADQHVIVYKPGSSTELLFGSDGGVFYTASGTSTQPFMEEHNKNYSTLQFYTCALNPTSGVQEFLGGLQDNGTLRYTGDPLTINNMVSGGDGAYCFYNDVDPSISIASVYYNWYTVFQNGGYINDNSWSSGVFVNPADYDYKLNRLYANAVDFIGTYQDNILRMNVPDVTTGTYIPMNTGSTVYFSALRYSPHSPTGQTTLFAGTQSGRLFRFDHMESTPNKTEITGSDFPAGNISSIAVGRSEDTLLVTFTNYGVPHVWQTWNGGQTWRSIDGNLPDMPVRWALFQPETSSIVMLATEAGVWLSANANDANVSWTTAIDGMANVRVDMLKLRPADNMVIAATHGRGIFTATFDVSTGIENKKNSSFRVSPNPAHGVVNISLKKNPTGNIRISVFDLAGRKVLCRDYAASSFSGALTMNLPSLSPGIYDFRLEENGKSIGSEKIIGSERVVVY